MKKTKIVLTSLTLLSSVFLANTALANEPTAEIILSSLTQSPSGKLGATNLNTPLPGVNRSYAQPPSTAKYSYKEGSSSLYYYGNDPKAIVLSIFQDNKRYNKHVIYSTNNKGQRYLASSEEYKFVYLVTNIKKHLDGEEFCAEVVIRVDCTRKEIKGSFDDTRGSLPTGDDYVISFSSSTHTTPVFVNKPYL